MNRNTLFSILLTFTFFVGYGQQQEVLGSAGMEVENATHQISFTIGEVVVETAQTEENLMTQGYHQSNLVITAVSEPLADLSISVYPNPTSDMVILESDHLEKVTNVQLYDMAGALVKSTHNDQSNQLTIDLRTISAGTYLMVAETDKDNQSSTFQIIKSH